MIYYWLSTDSLPDLARYIFSNSSVTQSVSFPGILLKVLANMPLCEGRSNGPSHHEPCPDKRADDSVRNRQGDLILCDSCTEYRFPDSKPIQQPDKVATRSAKLRATNNSAPAKSTSSFNATAKCQE